MSSFTLYENIYNFLLGSPSDLSVIFQLIEDDAWYPKDKLREIIHQAIIVVKKNYDQTLEKETYTIGEELFNFNLSKIIINILEVTYSRSF